MTDLATNATTRHCSTQGAQVVHPGANATVIESKIDRVVVREPGRRMAYHRTTRRWWRTIWKKPGALPSQRHATEGQAQTEPPGWPESRPPLEIPSTLQLQTEFRMETQTNYFGSTLHIFLTF